MSTQRSDEAEMYQKNMSRSVWAKMSTDATRHDHSAPECSDVLN